MSNLTESQIQMLGQPPLQYFDNKILNAFAQFNVYVIKKLIFTLISFKVWFSIILIWIATDLVRNDYISGSNWAAVVISLIGTVLVAREVAKIGHQKLVDKVQSTNPIVNVALNAADTIKDKILNETTDELDD